MVFMKYRKWRFPKEIRRPKPQSPDTNSKVDAKPARRPKLRLGLGPIPFSGTGGTG